MLNQEEHTIDKFTEASIAMIARHAGSAFDQASVLAFSQIARRTAEKMNHENLMDNTPAQPRFK